MGSHCRKKRTGNDLLSSDGILVRTVPDERIMNKTTDPLLITLSVLLAASVMAFFLGLIPYPYGLLVLGFFIISRVLYLKGKGE